MQALEADSSSSSACEVRINRLSGHVCTIDAAYFWTIREVKEAIASATGIPRLQQRLLCQSTSLHDEDRLSCALLGKPLCDLTLVLRTPEQARWLGLVDESGWAALFRDPERDSEAWADRDVAMEVVRQCGWALQHVAPELRLDRELVLTAVRNTGLALKHASPDLAEDRALALEAIAQCGRAMEFVGKPLRTDRDFILEAVQLNGHALAYVDPEFRRDREVVSVAVQHCGPALARAAAELREDPESLTEAVLRSSSKTTPMPCRQAPTSAGSADEIAAGAPERLPAAKRCTYFFGDGRSDGHLGMSDVLGKKQAQLCELANLGLPVVPGFCVTADTENMDKVARADVQNSIVELEQVVGKRFCDGAAPLLLSVRSDDSLNASREEICSDKCITNIGLNDDIVQTWMEQDNKHFVLDSYRRLITSYARTVKQLDMAPFERELEEARSRLDARNSFGQRHEDCHIPSNDLQYILERYKEIYEEQANEPFPQDPEVQLWEALRSVNSRTSPAKGSFLVQAMAFGNKDFGSAIGVAALRDPDAAEETAELDGAWVVSAQDEDMRINAKRTRQHLTRKASLEEAQSMGIEESERRPSLQEAMPGAYVRLAHFRDRVKSQLPDADAMEFVVQQGEVLINAAGVCSEAFSRQSSSKSVDEEINAAPAFDLSTEDLGMTFEEDVIGPSETEACLNAEINDNACEGQPPCIGFSNWHPQVDHPVLLARRPLAALPPVAVRAPSMRARHAARQVTAAAPSSQPPAAIPQRKPAPYLWQTAVAGGFGVTAARVASGVVSDCAMRANPASWSKLMLYARGFPAGVVNCTLYSNILSWASSDGNCDNVAPLARLGCAATAATSTTILTHTVGKAQALLQAEASGVTVGRWARIGGSSALFRGLPRTLASAVPVAAVELCAIDVAKNAGVASGFSIGPGLLFAAGGAAGVLAQTVLRLQQAGTHCLAAPLAGTCTSPASLSVFVGAQPGLVPQGVGLSYLKSIPHQNIGLSYLKSICGAGCNSLVRVGMMSYFASQSLLDL